MKAKLIALLFVVLCSGCVQCAPARSCLVSLNDECLERDFNAPWAVTAKGQ